MRAIATTPYWVVPHSSKQPNVAHETETIPELENLSIDPGTSGRMSSQSASPLYQIPRDIRKRIFELAVTRYEDFTTPFDMNFARQFSQYRLTMRDAGWPRYRVGHQHQRRICTALLETCKRIYSETRLVLISVHEHCIRYMPTRVRHLCEEFDTKADLPLTGAQYFSQMTSAQLAAVQKVHIFADRELLTAMDPGTYRSDTAWAELGFLRCGEGEGSRPRPATLLPEITWNLSGPFPQEFTITIGWNDWGMPGEQDFGLGNMLQNLHWQNVLGGVKVFKIELEKVAAEKAPLEFHIKQLLCTDFDIGNGEVLVPEVCAYHTTWTGERDYGPEPGYPDWRETEFYVISVTWRMELWKDTAHYSFLDS